MIKIFKRMFVFVFFAFLLPLCVSAVDYNLAFTCEKLDGTECAKDGNYIIEKGETVKLNFEVLGDNISGFESDILLQGATGPSNFEYNTSFWNLTQDGGFSNNKIVLAGLNGTGNSTFSFKITAGSSISSVVTFSSVDISDSNGDDHVLSENIVLTFDVVSGDNENIGGNDNENTGNDASDTNTNTDQNTNDTTNTGDTVKKSETDKPVNPKTGVRVSIFSFIVMAIGCVSYLVLRRKNYFNRI